MFSECNTFPIYDTDFNISVGFTMNRKVAYTGQVIDEQKFKDVRNCAKYCANRAGCSFFNFNLENFDCQIFMATNGGVENTNVISGGLSQACGSEFHPIGISAKTQFIVHHYTDSNNIVPLEPITAQTLKHMLAIETMMGPLGGKGDYWIDRDFTITKSERSEGAAHFVFELKWSHYFRVFEATLANSNVTKFVEAQSKFVKGVIADHTRYIEKNVRNLLNSGLYRSKNEFIVETFNSKNTFEIETDVANCEFEDDRLICECPEGFNGKGISCRDRNECYRLDSCEGPCLNTPGSYICLNKLKSMSCPAGYIGKFPDCIDIDECAQTSDLCPRDEQCVNTPGSYTCQCPDGYGGAFGCSKMQKTVCLETEERIFLHG